MEKTITIKGTGKVNLKPDLIVVSFKLSCIDRDYDKAVYTVAEKSKELKSKMVNLGFKENDLKTVDFSVNTQYRNFKDKNGNYKERFIGYQVQHFLKLKFDFDTKLLSQVINDITIGVTEPDINIQFSVKDKEKASNELLLNAAKDAKAKAELLAKASDAKLGEIIKIDYTWLDVDMYSKTNFDINEICCPMGIGSTNFDFEPENINLSDSVLFVWNLVEG